MRANRLRSISISKAKKRFDQLVQDVALTSCQTAISVNGCNRAVLISTDEYESLMETIEILKDQTLVKKIASSMKDVQKKNILKFDRIRRDS